MMTKPLFNWKCVFKFSAVAVPKDYMTSIQNSQKVQTKFWYSYLHESSIAHKLAIWHNQPFQSFGAACWTNVGLSFHCRAPGEQYFDLFFCFAELRSHQYLLLCWWSHSHKLCSSTVHYEVKLSVNIFATILIHVLSIRHLQIYLKIGAQSFGKRWQTSHQVFSAF